jgi:hypothetical protein
MHLGNSPSCLGTPLCAQALLGRLYFFRACFHELPARGLLFRTPQPLAFFRLCQLPFCFADPYVWFTELPNLAAP